MEGGARREPVAPCDEEAAEVCFGALDMLLGAIDETFEEEEVEAAILMAG